MKLHQLKTWPDPFRAMWQGFKSFELRRNDRGFEPGDKLVLLEWRPTAATDGKVTDGEYTGRAIVADVGWLLTGFSEWGLADGFCIMQLDALRRYDDWKPASERL